MFNPHNATTPNWAPLQRALTLATLPTETIGDFMWMYEEPAGVHHYKHCDTRAYVRLRLDTSAPACARDLQTAMPLVRV